MVPPVEVATPVTCPAVLVKILLEFVVSIPLVLLKESAMPSMRVVVVACSVDEAVFKARRVMFFCASKKFVVLRARQVPLMAKHPLVKLMPPVEVSVEVAVVKFPTPCMERIEPGVEVPMPTLPDVERKMEEVAVRMLVPL